MLNPKKRLDAEHLMTNPWINSAHQRYRQLSRSIVNSAFQNMKSFNIGYMLQRAVLMHMSKTDINNKEKENLKMIFDALDDEKDGELELGEFVE